MRSQGVFTQESCQISSLRNYLHRIGFHPRLFQETIMGILYCICSKMVVQSMVTWYPLYKAQYKKFILEFGIRNEELLFHSFYYERDEISCVDLATRKLGAESHASSQKRFILIIGLVTPSFAGPNILFLLYQHFHFNFFNDILCCKL